VVEIFSVVVFPIKRATGVVVSWVVVVVVVVVVVAVVAVSAASTVCGKHAANKASESTNAIPFPNFFIFSVPSEMIDILFHPDAVSFRIDLSYSFTGPEITVKNSI